MYLTLLNNCVYVTISPALYKSCQSWAHIDTTMAAVVTRQDTTPLLLLLLPLSRPHELLDNLLAAAFLLRTLLKAGGFDWGSSL